MINPQQGPKEPQMVNHHPTNGDPVTPKFGVMAELINLII